MEEYFTVKEVADRLKMRPRNIYEMIYRKILPSINIGVGRGTIRIKGSDLESYLKSKEVASESDN